MLRIAIAGLFLANLSVQAGTLTFASVGTALDPNQYHAGGASVAIAQHPLWASPLPGSSWVSFGTTGHPGAPGYIAPPNGFFLSFFQLVTFPSAPVNAVVTFRADDSAALVVNGQLLIAEAATTGNTYRVCSDIPAGCLVQTEISANITPFLTAGSNVIRFDVFQRSGVSFGLNYSGEASWNDPVPEPATFLLLGGGLLAVGLRRRLSASR